MAAADRRRRLHLRDAHRRGPYPRPRQGGVRLPRHSFVGPVPEPRPVGKPSARELVR